jgi:hypothetical protein
MMVETILTVFGLGVILAVSLALVVFLCVCVIETIRGGR